ACFALLPVTQIAIDARQRVLVFAALRSLARRFQLMNAALDLLQPARSHEVGVRAHRALRQVLGDLGAVRLAYECPTHGPSIAPPRSGRHRQLSGSKLTTDTMSIAKIGRAHV